MFEFLERLRKKPAHTRKSIALGVSITVTIIIFAVWLFNLIWNIDHPPVNAGAGPIESIVSGIGQGIQSVPYPLATTTFDGTDDKSGQ